MHNAQSARYVVPLMLVAGLCGCTPESPGTRGPLLDGGVAAGDPAAKILDVFFGLDDALPVRAGRLCPGAGGRDGMPVTFSVRVTPAKPSPGAFRVTTRSGATHTPLCAMLRPADDPGERHTVLLMGELGDAADPPIKLDIVGSVPLDSGGDAAGLSSTHVTPLAAGPSLLIASRYAPADLKGTSCPAPATVQIVQITWSGGVTRAGGGDPGDAERTRIHVSVTNPGGEAQEVTPLALADLGDEDNYIQLCLDDARTPVSVRAEAGILVDPRGDPNDATSVDVTPGR